MPGKDLERVYQALEWLVDFSLVYNGYKDSSEMLPLEDNMLVIGGGLTAVDVVDVPLRYLGEKIEKVYPSYNKTRKEAPMDFTEFDRLEKEYSDKLETLELAISVKSIGSRKGHVRKAVLQRTMLVHV